MSALPQTLPAWRFYLDLRSAVLLLQRSCAISVDLDDCRLVKLLTRCPRFLRFGGLAEANQERTIWKVNLWLPMPCKMG